MGILFSEVKTTKGMGRIVPGRKHWTRMCIEKWHSIRDLSVPWSSQQAWRWHFWSAIRHCILGEPKKKRLTRRTYSHCTQKYPWIVMILVYLRCSSFTKAKSSRTTPSSLDADSPKGKSNGRLQGILLSHTKGENWSIIPECRVVKGM